MTTTQQSTLSGLIIVPSQDVNPRSKNQSITNGGATGLARLPCAQPVRIVRRECDRRIYSGAGPPIIPRGEKSILKNATS
jgi:hypothetical protein